MLPSQVWWRWTAFAAHGGSPLIPWSGRPFCQPCGGGPFCPASPCATGWGADRPAGGPVQDSGPWEARPARRGSDRWPRGSPQLLAAQEEAALEASWETRPLYLQDENSGKSSERHQETNLNGDGLTHCVALIHIR